MSVLRQALSRGAIPRLWTPCILLAAAALKANAAHGWIAPMDELPIPRWLLAALLPAEIGLAAWLLSGLTPAWSRRVTLALFGAFLVVALAKALAGTRSCGCFGNVAVSPWLAAALDVVLWVGAWLWSPRPCRWPFACRLAAASLACLAGLWVLQSPRVDLEAADPFARQSVVVLEPHAWVGRTLPVLPYLDADADVSRGDWTVVFYRASCGECLEHAPRYRALAQAQQVLLVAVPPGPPDDAVRAAVGTGAVFRSLRSDRDWFVRTPALVKLHDGIVQGP